ncbi:MAG: DUF4244 domain-containing protein [Beutenbergiaceae bacterium]
MKDSRTRRQPPRRRPPGRPRPARELAVRSEAGMATAEYAIGTLAAVGFAGLLLVILKSDQVRTLLLDLITSALAVGG